MTRLTYMNEETSQDLHKEVEATSEAGQILHLKRLLVTLKQHYEKCLHASQLELQAEQNQRVASQKELENLQLRMKELQTYHEEELQALRDQQIALKDRVKKNQEESKLTSGSVTGEESVLTSSQQRVEQLERVIPYLRDQTKEATIETEQLREDLDRAQTKVKILEQELIESKQKAHHEIEHLQQIINNQLNQDDGIETVVSNTSSHHLKQELEVIKQTLSQDAKESKELEVRYVEILNEKIGLEHQCKQLLLQLEHQSSNLSSFQSQLHEMEQNRKSLDEELQNKDLQLSESFQKQQEIQEKIKLFDEMVREKDYVQDKYMQLKDEWAQLTEQLDETLESRSYAEQRLIEFETIVKELDTQLKDSTYQLEAVTQDKDSLMNERDQLRGYLEESESRLKVAQQHLAKKVKETALLNEKVSEQQNHLNEFIQTSESQKNQLIQFQSNIDLYQKQEKRLQEQLHDALKGTEIQVSKWEEKYFRMYDKWQESENQIRELKKFEEKHLQMQSMLANLGNFMGNSLSGSTPPYHPASENTERSGRPLGFEAPMMEQTMPPMVSSLSQQELSEEKFDLFGMRQPLDKSKPPIMP